MKTNNLFFILSCFVLLVSCSSESSIQTYSIQSFPKTLEVSLQEIKQFKGMSPANILFKDSLLIVQDFSKNPRIYFFDRLNYKELASYGGIGRGPHEFLNPQLILSSDSKNFIYINDFGTKNIYKVNLSKILSDNKTRESISKFTLPTKLHVSGSLYIDNNKIYGQNYETSTDSTYFIFNKLSTNYQYSGRILDNEYIDKMKAEDKKNANRNYVAYSKENNKIISGFLLFNIINIMDFDFNVEKQLVFGDEVLMPKDRDFFSEKNMHYYKSPICLKKSFFVLYNIGNSKKSEIHQFSYEGKTISRIILDKNYYNIYYDTKYKKLYAIDLEKDNSISSININLGQ